MTIAFTIVATLLAVYLVLYWWGGRLQAAQVTSSVSAPILAVPVEEQLQDYEPEPVGWLPVDKADAGVLGEQVQDAPTRFGVGGQVIDLAKVPHWLVAGATGMGKSNALNLILGQVALHDPDVLQLMLVDPKRVELAPYAVLPHCVGYADDTSDAVALLARAVDEMEDRYRLLKEARVRHIEGYAARTGVTLPRLLIVIDELADLMLTAGKTVEPLIQRLTQLGRAAGVHVIVATQRPSVDVVTGVIKANITGRLAFGVATAIDSRVILDQSGAEQLGNPGEALLSTGGPHAAVRVQLPYVEDGLVWRVTGDEYCVA